MMIKHPLVQMLAVMMTMTMLLLLHMTCADEFLTETAHHITEYNSMPYVPFRTSYCFLMSTLLYIILILKFKVIIGNHLQNGQIIKFAHVSPSPFLSLPSRRYLLRIRLSPPDYQQWSAPLSAQNTPIFGTPKPKLHNFLAYYKPKKTPIFGPLCDDDDDDDDDNVNF